MLKAVIMGLLIFALMMLIAHLQLPTEPENLQAACVGIFSIGLLTGIAIVAMHLDEIREV